MQEQINPLLCDIESGLCEVAVDQKDTTALETSKVIKKPISILYYTDPICSSCWGIEPQLRKLKLTYGNDFETEYKMGGLLKDWSYNSGQISKPTDVAVHWDEVSVHYDMPIDGDIWLEDPLDSSYPPSIAFKAAQMQNREKALLFLREIREMVFLQKKNITRWEHLEVAATKVGLDIIQFKNDYEGKARILFHEDVQAGKESGVRGFPTMIFTNAMGEQEFVYGSKSYGVLENVVLKLYPAATKLIYKTDWNSVFLKYNSLTANEYAQITGTERNQSEHILNGLAAEGKLEKLSTKNGAIWTPKKIQ
ncbi:DsbA family protein [Dyadobacter subterraneus]|uniref:DsbA family protein n=2 Tax=Dyadobacter subterraneus TaxID=2773304 RepID=A0ABR9WLU4_9BACT|nr:DsbA family protein [Dyadobacter subterraneus]MBE9466498.1 DsbA family protein [Dyadobacter subterraneus]